MKKLAILTLCLLALTTACNNMGKTAAGTDGDSVVVDYVEVADTDSVPMPVFLYYMTPEHMQVVYWIEMQEPTREGYGVNGMLASFEQSHASWVVQDMARKYAKGYTKLLSEGKYFNIKYIGETLTDPDGKEMFGGELHSKVTIPSPGLKYAFPDTSKAVKADYNEMFLILHDDYLKSYKMLRQKQLSDWENEKPFPKAVEQQLEKKYGLTVKRSMQSVRLGDRYAYGIVQFYPKGKKVLALEVLTDSSRVYAIPIEGSYDRNYENSYWNVDDGGVYSPSDVLGAFEGPGGLQVYVVHQSPESWTTGMFKLHEGAFQYQQYAVYHAMVDEQSPLWEKDLAQMRKLYLAEDPNENALYTLEKYDVIDVDEDGIEEFWLRDNDDRHGAIFTSKGGKVELIGTENGRMELSFLQTRDGVGYVKVSGSAGGPMLYTQVIEIKNSKVRHRVATLETNGVINECTFDGKPYDTEEGAAYINALPEAHKPFVYFKEIDM